MDLSMFQEFISPLALAGAFAVGYVVKNLIPNEEVNRFIPAIGAVVGAVITCWAEMDVTPMLFVSGLVSGLSATGLYEQVKNLTKSED